MKTVCLILILATAACSDVKSRRIPNALILAACAAWFVLALWEFKTQGAAFWTALKSEGVALLLVLLILLLVSALPGGGLGMGDIKLMMVMGLYLGARGLLYCLLLAFLLVLAAALAKNGLKGAGLRERLPLAPFFLAGTLLWLLSRTAGIWT